MANNVHTNNHNIVIFINIHIQTQTIEYQKQHCGKYNEIAFSIFSSSSFFLLRFACSLFSVHMHTKYNEWPVQIDDAKWSEREREHGNNNK